MLASSQPPALAFEPALTSSAACPGRICGQRCEWYACSLDSARFVSGCGVPPAEDTRNSFRSPIVA